MGIILRTLRFLIFTPLFSLPHSLKLKMSGGHALVIAGRTLNIDNQLLAANNSKGPQLDTMSPTKARLTFRQLSALTKGDLAKKLSVTHFSIPVEAGEIPARLYTPKALTKPSALLIYYHGGGVVVGDLDSYEVVAGDFAEQLNVQVLSVDYRLAPEHKFPTAALDAYAAYCWARAYAKTLNIDVNNILLAGDSAGGYLSAVTSLQAIQKQMPLPKGQILIYPMCDISTERESLNLFSEKLILTKSMMVYFTHHYINDESDRKDPLVSILFAKESELQQMPPTILTVAGFDPLHDEGIAFYEKLKSLNVNAQLIEHNDLTHGFMTLTGILKRGNEAKDEIIQMSKSLLN